MRAVTGWCWICIFRGMARTDVECMAGRDRVCRALGTEACSRGQLPRVLPATETNPRAWNNRHAGRPLPADRPHVAPQDVVAELQVSGPFIFSSNPKPRSVCAPVLLRRVVVRAV